MKVRLRNDELQKRLALKNKSQRWLALQINRSSGYVSQLVSGKRNPSPKTREQLMAKLGVTDFGELFEYNDSK